jgi:peptide/nickel transport system ATP-binding protein
VNPLYGEMEHSLSNYHGAAACPLLSAELTVDYPNKPLALRDVRFHLKKGEILGLIGQSGSGKSTVAGAILRLLDYSRARARGHVMFRGTDLLALKEREMRTLRGREIGLVMQSPLLALNPVLRVGTQLREAWRAHSRDRESGERRILELLRAVSLPVEENFLRRYPRQLSVGQAQRVVIAMAVLHRPSLLVADEPTSALDVITQAEVLELFGRLNCELGVAILFISHDLLSVASLCHRVAILHEGELVETGTANDVFTRPAHPYTRRLVGSLPVPSVTPTPDLRALQVAVQHEPQSARFGLLEDRFSRTGSLAETTISALPPVANKG